MDKGGPAVKVRSLARGMAAAGHEVTVLTADQGLDTAMQEIAHAVPSGCGFEAKEGGVKIIYLRTSARYRALTWNPGVAEFWKERLSSFDLVHIYGLYDLIGPRVASACRRIGRLYVVEPMGMFQQIVRSFLLKRMYQALLGKAMLRGATRFIATAEQEREELLAGGIPDSQIVMGHNGIDIPENFPPRLFRNQWDIPEDVRLVLFLGRLVSK